MKIELVIFDMDGLMFDTENVTFRAYMEIGKERGLVTNRQQYVQILGLKREDIENVYRGFFGKDFDAVQFYHDVAQRKLDILSREGIPVKSGLRELLEDLEERNIKRVVASGSATDTIQGCLAQSGLIEKFDMILSSQSVKRGKPAPDVFLEVCKRMEVEPGQALVLEDSINGIQAALAGGIKVIAIPDMIPIPPELQKQCYDVVKTLKDVRSRL